MNIGDAVGLVPVIVSTKVVTDNVEALSPKKKMKCVKVKKVKKWKI